MGSKTLNIILGIVVLVLLGWLIYSQGWLNKPINNVINSTNDNQILGNSANQVPNNTDKNSKYYVATFENTKEGYSFNYYPNVKDSNGYGMVDSDSYGVGDPRLATNLSITDRGGWTPGFQISISNLVVDGASDEMTLKEYAEYLWENNKNDPKPSANKWFSELVKTTLAGQSTYRFEAMGTFANRSKATVEGWGGWLLDQKTAYIFFRSQSGKIMTVEYHPIDHPIVKKIVDSIRV